MTPEESLVHFIDGDPPLARGGVYAAIVEELRARPGQWAIVFSDPADVDRCYNAARYLRKCFRELEVVVRSRQVYARAWKR